MRAPTDLLASLVRESERETAAQRARRPLHELERQAASAPAPRDLAAALRAPGLSVIAEMKARTPRCGALAGSYSPARLARLYTSAGAAALSVLSQATSFGGSPRHLAEARAETDLPIMRKDFVVDEYQVVEARALGADAVLLIVAALPPVRLRVLLELTRDLDMEALVEAHDAAEVEAALAAGALLIGLNHRDLRTFQVDGTLTRRLRAMVPADRVLVAESGVRGAEDARRLGQAGADAVLVGEALMRAADPTAKLTELVRTPP